MNFGHAVAKVPAGFLQLRIDERKTLAWERGGVHEYIIRRFSVFVAVDVARALVPVASAQ